MVEVLQAEFGKTLGDPGVVILDPATWTGNFIVNLLRRIPKHDLEHAYKERLFANDVMLLPYYIAALNIEHAYYDLTGSYESFEGCRGCLQTRATSGIPRPGTCKGAYRMILVLTLSSLQIAQSSSDWVVMVS